MNYIGRKMIEDGLMAKVIIPRLECGEVAAQIGDYWFWFYAGEYQFTDPKEIPFNVLVESIKDCLDAFHAFPRIFQDEYNYYYHYLCENI